MAATYYLIIRGSLPAAVGDVLRRRFGDVHICSAAARTVIECSIADQPGLRALLTQVWDVGGEVLLLADVTLTSDRELR